MLTKIFDTAALISVVISIRHKGADIVPTLSWFCTSTDQQLRVQKITLCEASRAQDDRMISRMPADNMQAHLPIRPILLLRPSVQHNLTASKLKLPRFLSRNINLKSV